MIQWYFDFEQVMFQDHDTASISEGERKYDLTHIHLRNMVLEHQDMYAQLSNKILTFLPAPSTAPANSTVKRKLHVDMGLGMVGGKTNIPFPKQYIPSTTHSEHYGYSIRVFAKCINGGWHDMITIMLMTQSL